MILGEQQRLFTRLVGLWITEVYKRGFELSMGEAKRSDEQAIINAMGPAGRATLVSFLMRSYPDLAGAISNNVGSGIRNSLHELQLAEDFNLFKSGKYLSSTEDWREVGELWESMHPLARWGGRFGDGNHISLEYGGRK